jgi:pimeloyl-ACP methyl ester carboxylesterase
METEHVVPVEGDRALSAVHHEAGGNAWIVFCHGFLSDKTGSYEGRCREAVERGYDAVRFDFRGCGESDGAFAESTLSARIADLEAVLDYFDPDSCVLFGSSFGGAVAFHAAVGDDRVEAVATRAPVTYGAFDDVRATVETEGEVRFDDGRTIDARFVDDLDGHDFGDVAAGLGCPAAIFHGDDDASVAIADSFRAAEDLGVDVFVQKYVGEGHRFSREAEARMRRAMFEWLDRV